jgi:hypothetical protein
MIAGRVIILFASDVVECLLQDYISKCTDWLLVAI